MGRKKNMIDMFVANKLVISGPVAAAHWRNGDHNNRVDSHTSDVRRRIDRNGHFVPGEYGENGEEKKRKHKVY